MNQLKYSVCIAVEIYVLVVARVLYFVVFFFSSRRRHTRWTGDWSSDVCSSDLTLHRVVDPPDPAAAAARRQSMPYFQNANWSAEVSCLPTCLEPGDKPRYEPVLAGPHLMAKFRRSVTLSARPGAAYSDGAGSNSSSQATLTPANTRMISSAASTRRGAAWSPSLAALCGAMASSPMRRYKTIADM